ncbi:MAG: hypothetical protein AVO39_02875 [delta proteobacterium MLS_D]|jgi:hypothetical protein|nr:MAG: hypothetical protein AVO39_02875 [delta proteobacterium MLS_D]
MAGIVKFYCSLFTVGKGQNVFYQDPRFVQKTGEGDVHFLQNMPRVSDGPCVRNPSAERMLLLLTSVKKHTVSVM